MKNTYKILLAFATVAITASCSLNLEPETTLTDSNFWNTENDLRGACNRLYQQMSGNLGGYFSDFRSDELVGNTSDAISDGSRTVPSTSTDWSDPYWRINISNNILHKAPKADVSEEVLNQYLGEAYFFRAFHYFELVKKYGDVPLITDIIESTTDPRIDSPRTEREKVIQQCYSDLEFAQKWLPDIDNQTWGYVSKSAAYALMTRIGLYEGTRAKYHQYEGVNYNNHLDKAISAAKWLIDSKKHSLYPDFYKMFQLEGVGRQNREAIFVRIYGPNDTYEVTNGHRSALENSINLSKNIVDLILYTDGLPEGKTKVKPAVIDGYNKSFENRDPRMGLTCVMANEEYISAKGVFKTFFEQAKGYKIKKGHQHDPDKSGQCIDKMVIRYAEVLVSYAEALYERNGVITDDQLDETVNALRARVGFNVKLTNAFASANGLDMLEEIRRERTVEFLEECMRYDDIMRWKIAEKVMVVDLIGAKYNAEETIATYEELKAMFNENDEYVMSKASDRRFDPAKDYLYPIPLKEISLSGGNVKQNPGW